VVALLLIAWAAPASADKVDDLALKLRSDPDYKVRLSAALNLGKLGDRRAIGALIDGVGDADKTVRAVSAAALGKIVHARVRADQRERARGALEAAARGAPDPLVRQQAQKSLDSLSSRVYVEIGPMADTTKRGAGVIPIMRRELLASLNRRAPSYQTSWPS